MFKALTTGFVSCASAKAERDLSNLYGVFFVCRIGGPPRIKQISDLYRFELTNLTPPPSQNFTGAYHHVTPPLVKEILMTTDMTWPKRPPPS